MSASLTNRKDPMFRKITSGNPQRRHMGQVTYSRYSLSDHGLAKLYLMQHGAGPWTKPHAERP
jgi:hypothetical protein